MALKIRLRRMGRKKAPHYRIVVAESSMPRDGRFVATIGHYNPRTDPLTLVVDRDKARQWIKNGAKPTETVESLLKRAGVYSDEPVAAPVTGAVKTAAKTVAAAAATVAETVAETVSDAVETVAETVSDAIEAVTGGEEKAGEGEAATEAVAEAETATETETESRQ
jgi:small subunit ribosomal protein S16